jgi:hypothetical protein
MERDLLQGTENARIQFRGRALSSNSPWQRVDEAGQHEDTGIIR